MDFTSIGSLTGYVKNMKLQSKWRQKKNTGNFTPDNSKCEKRLRNEQFIQSYKEQRENNQKDETLSSIHAKINTGAKLTPEEMQYLQTKDPITYQKVKNLENEKIAYERELKRCKAKEDVQKLKISRITASMSAINSVKNNPNIPKGTKLAVAMEEQRRTEALNKIEYKFVQSGEYAKLPDKTEVSKAEKDMQKADEYERYEHTENSKTIYSSENEKYKTEETLVNNDKITKLEAEQTPEAKKVKRSKAKKAYLNTENINWNETVHNILDFKDKA